MDKKVTVEVTIPSGDYCGWDEDSPCELYAYSDLQGSICKYVQTRFPDENEQLNDEGDLPIKHCLCPNPGECNGN